MKGRPGRRLGWPLFGDQPSPVSTLSSGQLKGSSRCAESGDFLGGDAAHTLVIRVPARPARHVGPRTVDAVGVAVTRSRYTRRLFRVSLAISRILSRACASPSLRT